MENSVELEKGCLRIKTSSQKKILFNYIFNTLPQVKKSLRYWENQAYKIENEVLREQALCSLKNKAFHCYGGAVYAHNQFEADNLVELIVAYQTICDYLDNLCDRAGITEAKAFTVLHQALLDALKPDEKYSDYYQDYIYKNDSGYLAELVKCCKKIINQLPSYDKVYDDIIFLTNLYINLQVKKHLDWSERENVLKKWAFENIDKYPLIYWQEFAAASGSTLAVFFLFSLAGQNHVNSFMVKDAVNAYFPWICGLHILLDYVIDQEEDKSAGDLNFTFYYNNDKEMIKRLKLFAAEAKKCAMLLPPEIFHLTVVQGLLAMYLSDNKITINKKKWIKVELLKEMNDNTINIYRVCKTVRKLKHL